MTPTSNEGELISAGVRNTIFQGYTTKQFYFRQLQATALNFPLLASMPSPIQHLAVGRPLKKFAFVSAAAEREYKELPKDVQDDFGKDLRRIQYGQDPERPIKSLTESVGAGAIELIINCSPAFRCVYVAKFADMVVVLHSFVKTTNRPDRHAMQVAEERMKELKQELRKMGYRV